MDTLDNIDSDLMLEIWVKLSIEYWREMWKVELVKEDQWSRAKLIKCEEMLDNRCGWKKK